MKLFSLIFFISLVSFQDELRTWVDASGKFKIEAELVSVNGENVKLRKANGQVIEVEIARLSPGSRVLLKPYQSNIIKDKKFKEKYKRHEMKLGWATEITRFYEEELKRQITDIEKKYIHHRIKELELHSENQAALVEGEFITPYEMVNERRRCQKLIEQWRSLTANSTDRRSDVSIEAKKIIREAQGIEPFFGADFNLGLSNVLLQKDFVAAEDNFKECVKRYRKYSFLFAKPVDKLNYTHCLGNLALLKIRRGDVSEAVSLWEELIEITGGTPEFAYNINRILKLNSLGSLDLKKTQARKISEWCTKYPSQYASQSLGWLYMPYQPVQQSSGISDYNERGENILWYGTGFVVAPGFLLTNKHVVEYDDTGELCDRFRLKFAPTTERKSLLGKVVARSEHLDLALIECGELKSSGIPIETRDAKAAEDIFILGYPDPNKLGSKLKITRGLISQTPTRSEEKLLTDAISNPGNSGGPMINENGNAMGVLTWGTTGQGRNYAIGIPGNQIFGFLEKHIPSYTSLNAQRSLSPAEIMAEGKKNVLQIESIVDDDKINFHRINDDMKERNIFTNLADKACFQCAGKGKIKCYIKGCSKGKVTKETLRKEPVPFSSGGKFYMRRVKYTEPCATCRGKDEVVCPKCAGSGEE